MVEQKIRFSIQRRRLEIRRYKNLTTSKNIIKDISAALNWVKEKYPKKKISSIGFSLGVCSIYSFFKKE